MSRITPRTASRPERLVIDLSVPHPEGGYDPEAAPPEILIWHGDDPAFPADGLAVIERLPLPSPGCEWDVTCPDCNSAVTLFRGVPASAAAAAAGVTHSPSCPWLARQIRSGAA